MVHPPDAGMVLSDGADLSVPCCRHSPRFSVPLSFGSWLSEHDYYRSLFLIS